MQEIDYYKCNQCGRIYSKLQAELIKFDPCICGNKFKDTQDYKIFWKTDKEIKLGGKEE